MPEPACPAPLQPAAPGSQHLTANATQGASSSGSCIHQHRGALGSSEPPCPRANLHLEDSVHLILSPALQLSTTALTSWLSNPCCDTGLPSPAQASGAEFQPQVASSVHQAHSLTLMLPHSQTTVPTSLRMSSEQTNW